MYDPQTRSELQTGQRFASKNNATDGVAGNLLAAAEGDDGGVMDGDDVVDVSRPRRQGAGRGLVVELARSSLLCRVGCQSAVTSAMAARVEDSSTMALSAANAATRAWTARLLTARG